MPNPLLISDAVDLTNVAIQDVWIKGSEKESRLFESYFNVETGVVDYFIKDSSVSGLGYAGRIVENAAVTASSPVQGYNQTYTQVQFGVLLSFTKMMWYFGIKKRKIEEIVEEASVFYECVKAQTAAEEHKPSADKTHTYWKVLNK